MAESSVLSLKRTVDFGYFEVISHLDQDIYNFRLLLLIRQGFQVAELGVFLLGEALLFVVR